MNAERWPWSGAAPARIGLPRFAVALPGELRRLAAHAKTDPRLSRVPCPKSTGATLSLTAQDTAVENAQNPRSHSIPTVPNRPGFLGTSQLIGDEAPRADCGRLSWGLSDAFTARANGAAPAYLDRQ